jgi:oligopeptidase B
MGALSGEVMFFGSAAALVAMARRGRATPRRMLSGTQTQTQTQTQGGVYKQGTAGSVVTAAQKGPAVPPVAAKLRENMYFGKHPDRPDEFRGPSVMDPPILRQDDYNWMRDESRKDEKVLGLIRQENEFCEQEMSRLDPLKKNLYTSMVGYMKESDEEVPYLRGDFYYYSKTLQALAYKLHCRYHKSLGLLENTHDADATAGDRSHSVILDENDLAKGTDYCDVTPVYPSPSQNKLIYGVDSNGSEFYQVYVKDLVLGANLPDVLTDVSDNFVWGNDDSTVYYVKQDEQHRPHEVWLHVLGTAQEEDALLYREDDQLFNVDVRKSASGEYLFLGSHSIETSEERIISLKGACGASDHIRTSSIEQMMLVQQRVVGLRYSGEHRGDKFYFVTNDNNAHNSKLVELPIDTAYTGGEKKLIRDLAGQGKWADVRQYDDSIEVTELLPFRCGLVILGRESGLQQVWLSMPGDTSECSQWSRLSYEDEIYAVDETNNHCYDADVVRLRYSSFVTPTQIIDVSLRTKERKILKEQIVPGYDRTKYACKRVFVPSSTDGALVPLSLLYLKNQLDESPTSTPSPALLYAYGSYGVCKEPSFDYTILPLVDFGIVFAVGHIRGGGEMGRSSWYEKGGKYFTKMNTFTDFADCAKYLIASGITEPSKLAMSGRSAGLS